MDARLQRRLMLEYRSFLQDMPLGVNVRPRGEFVTWDARILGPEGTPFEGAVFDLTIQFGAQYPNNPPKITFANPPPFHPNVYSDGSICLDMLQNKWTPSYNTACVLAALQSLLADPNPESPANSEAASDFVERRAVYERKVRVHARCRVPMVPFENGTDENQSKKDVTTKEDGEERAKRRRKVEELKSSK